MRIILAITILLNLAVYGAEEKAVTVGLIGDSTVAVQSGWGPAFATRFDRRVKIVNYAKNGATLQALSKKLDELVQLKPDYVLIQFGHNDQKRYDTAVYSDHLRSYVERIRKSGGKAVIVSSVTRRSFDAQGKIVSNLVKTEKYSYKGTLTDYANAAEAVAVELKLPFIDLHAASILHHSKIGREESMTYNFKEGDNTHFNKKGSKAITGLILKELNTVVPELATYLKKSGSTNHDDNADKLFESVLSARKVWPLQGNSKPLANGGFPDVPDCSFRHFKGLRHSDRGRLICIRACRYSHLGWQCWGRPLEYRCQLDQ